MNPMKARIETVAEIRSPYKAFLWIANPIMLYNLRRARLGQRPYWKRWHSLSLISRPKGWNSYALFVEGQDFPRIVLKKLIPVYTSYGIRTGFIRGVIYYNQPEELFMHVYMENVNFGKAFDFSHERSFEYNDNPEMKKRIVKKCVEELRENAKLFWDHRLVGYYLKMLENLYSSISQ